MSLLTSVFGVRTSPRARRTPASPFEQLEARQLMTFSPFAPGDQIAKLVTTYGDIWIELYTQATPNTVSNFLQYVNSNRYDGTFMHRLATGFVLQMGGYKLDASNNQAHIETFPPVANEVPAGAPSTWPTERRNLIRTVAMAKQGGDPNSATSEFFFNLGDNSANLDSQNGGFTVFGYIVQGWDVVLKITTLEVIDASNGDPNSAFTNLPVTPHFDPKVTLTNADLVLINDVQLINNPLWSQKPSSGQVLNGAGKADGETLFVTINELGRAIAFYQPSATGAWTVSDINIQSGGPVITGTFHAWADPKDGLFYGAATTAAGVLLYQRSSAGFWTFRNLTSEINGATKITVSDITTFLGVDTNELAYIAGINAQGHMVLYAQTTDAPANGAFNWRYQDLVSDLTANGQTMPSFKSTAQLTSYVTSWNGLNIAGVDTQGNIQTIWWAAPNPSWQTSNLSAITGAQPFTGNVITPYTTSWGGINLAGTDSGGNVVVTWWVPSFGGTWQTNNLTSQFSGPTLQIDSISSYVTPWGGLNIAGLDGNGKITVYWWAPGLTDWNVTVDLVTGAQQPAQRITGVASLDGTINLGARGTNGDAMRYFWRPPPETPWTSENLSAVATFF